MVNKNINNNTSQINNETLNTTASFSSYNDINNNLTQMNSNSFMNFGYHNFNNYFCKEKGSFIFNRSKKCHNSFFAGDKTCFNLSLFK